MPRKRAILSRKSWMAHDLKALGDGGGCACSLFRLVVDKVQFRTRKQDKGRQEHKSES